MYNTHIHIHVFYIYVILTVFICGELLKIAINFSYLCMPVPLECDFGSPQIKRWNVCPDPLNLCLLSHVACLAKGTSADMVLAEAWKMLGLLCSDSCCCTWNPETTIWIGEQSVYSPAGEHRMNRSCGGNLRCRGQRPANCRLWVRSCSTIQPQPSLQKTT